MIKRLLSSGMLVLGCLYGTASMADFEQKVLDSFKTDVQDIPGENIDLFHGKLSWKIHEVHLPGPNGMDIDLYRTNKGGYENGSGWMYDYPMLTEDYSYQCLKNCDHQYTESRVVKGGLILRIPGMENIVFGEYRKGNTSTPTFGQYADLHTSKWSAEKPDDKTVKIFTADGRFYTFSGRVRVKKDNVDFEYYSYVLYEDGFGNKITYSIDEHGLKSVASNDGRSVNIEYEKYIYQVAHHSKDNDVDEGAVYNPIKVTANSDNTSQEWTLAYNHAHSSSVTRLDKVITPEGRVWQYDEDSNHFFGMQPVVLPTGALIKYDTAEKYGRQCISKTIVNNGSEQVWYYCPAYKYFNTSEPISRIPIYKKYEDNAIVITPTAIVKYKFYNGDYYYGNKFGEVEDVYSYAASDTNMASPLRHVHYDYYIETPISYSSNVDESLGLGRFASRAWVQKVTVDDKYVTEYSNLDAANFWQTKTETTNGQQRVTHYTYQHIKSNGSSPQSMGLLTKEQVDGDNGETWVTTNTYDGKGKLIHQVVNGQPTHYTYTSQGELATKMYTNHRGQQTITYADYYRGVARKETYPDGGVVTRAVNPSGTIAWEDDPLGNRTRYVYDGLNRVTYYQRPGLAPTRYRYEPNRITVTRDNSGYVKTYDLDGLGRVTLTTEQGNGIAPVYVRTRYDAGGRVDFASYPSNSASESRGVSTTYDALNRILTQTHNTDGAQTSYCYGSSCASYLTGLSYDDAVVVTDPRGYKTAFLKQGFGSPDDLWNRTIVADIAGSHRQLTEISRNKLGDITQLVQDGVTRSYAYYAGKRLLRTVTEPERGTQTYTYDAAGNLLSRKTGGLEPITFTYDQMNRLYHTEYPAAIGNVQASDAVDYRYDKAGQLIGMNKGAVKRTFGYTTWGSLWWEWLTFNDTTYRMVYGFNNHGAVSSLSFPNGKKLSYTLDDWDRPVALGQFVSNISYYPSGQLASYTYGNGQKTSFSLNNRNFVSQILSQSSSLKAMQQQYSFDKNANVTAIKDLVVASNSISQLGYDGLERLIVANGSWGNGTFSYDNRGNLTKKSLGVMGVMNYTYASNNRLASTSGSQSNTFSYDPYGNTTANGRLTMSYSHAGELRTITNADNTLNTSYRYDGDGIRVLEIKDGKNRFQIHDKKGDLVYEDDRVDNKQVIYVRLNGQTLAKVDSCITSTGCTTSAVADSLFTPQ